MNDQIVTDHWRLELLGANNDATTLRTEPAGVGEDRGAVALQVLGVVDPRSRLRQELGEPCLALLERPWPPVLAVELEQVEGVEDHLAVIRPAMELVEDRRPSPSHQTASPSITAWTP